MSRPIASFVCFFVISIPVNAAEPVSRALNSGWQFRALESTDHPGVQNWHTAQVPGVVHTDLLRNGLIPEPFDQDNEFRLHWIGLTDWEYQTTFQVDADTLAHAHVDLVCQGLDTFADVYLNGQAILRTNNMFRTLAPFRQTVVGGRKQYVANCLSLSREVHASLRKISALLVALHFDP